MQRIMLILCLSIACGDDDSHVASDKEHYIYTSGNAESRGRLALSSSAPLPKVTKLIYTESFYADVTASDRLQIVFLVDDSATMAQARQKLSTSLAAMLKHVINSNWSVAVTTLHTRNYPQASITKYDDSFDYEKKFSQAVMDLKQATKPERDDKEHVRAYVIVTDNDLTEETRTNVENMLAAGNNNRVYALLDTDGNSSAFIDWRDAEGEKVINRYAALKIENYALPLQEMSRDLASVLRSNFFLRGYRALEGWQMRFSGGYFHAKVAWNPSRSGQTGDVSIESLKPSKNKDSRTIFINSKLPAGMCIDTRYSIGR